MTDQAEKRVFLWRIRCIDRQTLEMFDRDLIFDSDEKSEEFFARHDSEGNGPWILEYRKCFRGYTDDEFLSIADGVSDFRTCALGGMEYFEDEDCNGLNEFQLMQIRSGDQDVIVMGNRESILRLGPVSMKDKDAWTAENANDITHLFQLVQRIGGGTWLRSEMRLEVGAETELKFPSDESTDGVLLAVRQLLEKRDKAFHVACGHYVEHVDDERKSVWVQERVDCFDRTRTSHPLPKIDELTIEDVIELYAYGGRRVHRDPNDKTITARYKQLVKKHGQENVKFAFGMSCKQLLNPVFDVAPIIAQDYVHWIKNEGCVDSVQTPLAELLG